MCSSQTVHSYITKVSANACIRCDIDQFGKLLKLVFSCSSQKCLSHDVFLKRWNNDKSVCVGGGRVANH